MRTSLLLFVPLLAAFPSAGRLAQLNSGRNGAPTPSVIDTAAARVHSQMLRAMGGEGAWKKARYFEFDFVVMRDGKESGRWRHHWDRWRGDYRLSGVRAGDTIVARFNINNPKAGSVTVNGVQPVATRRDSLLTFAYARHINDAYWLIMPYKWLDEGVTLSYQGAQTDSAGKRWEVVKLTFADVGLTPQNQYLAFVNPQSWLMERWYHFPREGAQPLRFDWKNWQKFGPIMLATEKPSLDNSLVIRFDNVRVLTSVPKGAFD
jgi:hypothetical protein